MARFIMRPAALLAIALLACRNDADIPRRFVGEFRQQHRTGYNIFRLKRDGAAEYLNAHSIGGAPGSIAEFGRFTVLGDTAFVHMPMGGGENAETLRFRLAGDSLVLMDNPHGFDPVFLRTND